MRTREILHCAYWIRYGINIIFVVRTAIIYSSCDTQFLPQSVQVADNMWTTKLHYDGKGVFPSQGSIPFHSSVMICKPSWAGMRCFVWAINCEHFCKHWLILDSLLVLLFGLLPEAELMLGSLAALASHHRKGFQIGSVVCAAGGGCGLVDCSLLAFLHPECDQGVAKSWWKKGGGEGCWQHSSNRILKPQLGNCTGLEEPQGWRGQEAMNLKTALKGNRWKEGRIHQDTHRPKSRHRGILEILIKSMNYYCQKRRKFQLAVDIWEGIHFHRQPGSESPTFCEIYFT